MKEAIFHPRVIEFVRGLTRQARKEIGEAIRDLQKGLFVTMPSSRPMPGVASGVHELRIKEEGKQIRIFYYLKLGDRVLIFHAFEKKTQKTPRFEIELGKKRLRELLQ